MLADSSQVCTALFEKQASPCLLPLPITLGSQMAHFPFHLPPSLRWHSCLLCPKSSQLHCSWLTRTAHQLSVTHLCLSWHPTLGQGPCSLLSLYRDPLLLTVITGEKTLSCEHFELSAVISHVHQGSQMPGTVPGTQNVLIQTCGTSG